MFLGPHFLGTLSQPPNNFEFRHSEIISKIGLDIPTKHEH